MSGGCHFHFLHFLSLHLDIWGLGSGLNHLCPPSGQPGEVTDMLSPSSHTPSSLHWGTHILDTSLLCSLKLSAFWPGYIFPLVLVAQSLWPRGLYPFRPLCPWDSPGKSTGIGCHFLLQGIFPTQRLNLSLLSPATVGRFFTTSATWEAELPSPNCNLVF